MGLATLLLFPLVGWILYLFIPNSFKTPFELMFYIHPQHYFYIPIFLSIGILFGLFVIWLTELNYFEKSMSKYKNILENFELNIFYVVFLSVAAGVGEEIFFRGVLQPIFGIVITAIFFVAIHGYFSLKNKRINIFAILLTGFICVLGWGSKDISLLVAMCAHFAYDLVLLFYYKNYNK